MVHHHRPYHHKQNLHSCSERYLGALKMASPRLLRRLFIFSLVSCSFLFGPLLLLGAGPSLFPFFLYSFGAADQEDSTASHRSSEANVKVPCFSVPDNSICCDRTSSFRTDVCVLRGDVRTRSSASSVFLYSASFSFPAAAAPSSRNRKKQWNSTSAAGSAAFVEKIRPYTRKWETSIMDTIGQLDLVVRRKPASDAHKCDVVHGVPAVVFSTGGYTGNTYHEFNDGVIPLYITSQHFNRQVVFVILEYHPWWITKYADILSHLSAYPPIEFSGDKRTHCFPEVTVGLRFHEELTVDASLMRGNRSMLDFRRLLDDAYRPRIRSLAQEDQKRAKAAAEAAALVRAEGKKEAEASPEPSLGMVGGEKTPNLVIISRNGSRGIENERELVELCEKIGFQVVVLRPDRTTELAKIYRALNASDVMIGVHGAALTHFLFMRPGSVFIQVVPLGIDWAAETCFGGPAVRMGLKYVAYKIQPNESSLYTQYDEVDPVLTDPKSVTTQGWQMTKKVYLDSQSVRLDLNRFLERLTRAYQYIVSWKMNEASLRWNEN